jgi:penicillin-binding protein 1A
MLAALEDQPGRPFRVPPGIEFVTIDRQTGQRASGGEGTITEAFKPGEGPVSNPSVLDGSAVAGFGGGYGYGMPSTAGVGIVPMPGTWGAPAPGGQPDRFLQPGQPVPPGGGQVGAVPPPPGGGAAPQAGGLY